MGQVDTGGFEKAAGILLCREVDTESALAHAHLCTLLHDLRPIH
ncbi:MAG: hypothetical protein BWY63_03909 [Chloroflexi bacterium ADurb.Bin360]|nr:MAG: hypothetical protein BWY63_03909 [Chloroflexi bacterium ADurb.Bin360]